MSKKSAARRNAANASTPRPAEPRPGVEVPRTGRPRWHWLAMLVVGAGVGFGLTWFLGGNDGPPGPAPEGMVWIPGGKFTMGTTDSNKHFSDARPEHEVELAGFWIDETEVTNAQYAAFVKATGYVTLAEQKPTLESIRAGLPPDAPDPDPAVMVPGALVFTQPPGPVPNDHRFWWKWVPGACWKHPEGPGSDIAGRMDHPVVHVCWKDAVAYCDWAGKRLPTEAEWERAACGGLAGKKYAWGDEPPDDGGKWRCNIWQGDFPQHNSLADGFLRTCPVRSFPPNGYGLYEAAGNVWEWCSDWYDPDAYKNAPRKNPGGPERSFDPTEPNPRVPKRVTRGGSFLCSDGFCSRYKPYGRGRDEVDSGQSHIGFRCVKDAR